MRHAGNQPYFFPYLGYFALIKHTDHWVVADNTQFIKGGWIDRNRILKPNNGWQYIQAPLIKASHRLPINARKIRNEEAWQEKIFRQLEHYKKKAPHYKTVIDLLKQVFDVKTDSIVELDIKGLKVVCQYLDIPFQYEYLSNIQINRENIHDSDELALEMTKALGADEYWNLPSGRFFYDRSKFEKNHISIKFLIVNLRPYEQRRKDFEPGLSIIDVMMFNSPETINEMLDDYELE